MKSNSYAGSSKIAIDTILVMMAFHIFELLADGRLSHGLFGSSWGSGWSALLRSGRLVVGGLVVRCCFMLWSFVLRCGLGSCLGLGLVCLSVMGSHGFVV